ncbi:hypothetical protein D3C81_778170 [compost metagenome]
MAYSEPNCWVLPTPGTREICSSTRAPTMSFNASRSTLPSSERTPMAIRKPALALATTTPCWVTSEGSRGVANETLFCTCTWAISASVPLSKVRVMVTRPLDEDDELKYIRLSMPVSCCSITWVTDFSAVAALAPG